MEKTVGRLWIKKGAGKLVASGVLKLPTGDVKVVVFKNESKREGKNDPDFDIVVAREQGGAR